jgi:predicted site-specific integrase-resolvase
METQTQSIQSTVSIPRLAFSLAEVEVSSGLSRSTLYRMIGAGELKTVTRRGRKLVPLAEVERLCGAEQEDSANA